MAPESFAEAFLDRLRASGVNAYQLIESMVGQPEDLYLDFKRKENPASAALSDADKRNLSKSLSGLAHSVGGLIIWGVEASRGGNDLEEADVARALCPIQNVAAFHTNLNTLIGTATRPPIPNATNFKVERPDGSGYVVTYVPVGEVPPYRAEWAGGKFYKRSGSNFYPMEPYDLRDIILRGNYPKIRLRFGYSRETSRTFSDMQVYQLLVQAENLGPTILHTWKLVLEYSMAINARKLIQIADDPFAYEEFNGPDGGRWERATFASFKDRRVSSHYQPLLPDDPVLLVGPGSSFRVIYQMRSEVLFQGGRDIRWKFIGANIPSQSGTIHVGRGSFCDY